MTKRRRFQPVAPDQRAEQMQIAQAAAQSLRDQGCTKVHAYFANEPRVEIPRDPDAALWRRVVERMVEGE